MTPFDYRRRGWRLVPIPPGRKGPTHVGWQDRIISLEQIERHIDGSGKVGAIMGNRSGGLVDADLDCREALDFADTYLPVTGC